MRLRRAAIAAAASLLVCAGLNLPSISAAGSDRSSPEGLLTLSETKSPPTAALRVQGTGEAPPPGVLYGHQTRALTLLEGYASHHADVYVSHGVNRIGGPEEYFLNFTDRPGDDVFKILAAEPFSTTVSWGFPANAAALEKASDELAGALHSDPDVVAIRVGPVAEMSGQGIEATVELRPGARSLELIRQSGLQTANQELGALPTSGSLPTMIVPGEGVGFTQTAAVKGGHAVTCGRTTGFTASWSQSLGVLTAGHGSCSGISTYDGAGGVVSSAGTPRRPSAGSGFLDTWFVATQSGNTTTKVFRDGGSSETTVTGVGTPSQSMSICKYGLATGRDCGSQNPLYITNSVSFCATATGDGVLYCRLWATNRNVVQEGDSGGPWFVGGGAYGTTSGLSGDSSFLTAASSISSSGLVIRQN